MQFHYRIHWHLLRLLFRGYFGFTIRGEENVPPDGPLLIASNHCSHVDPPMIAVALNRQITFMAKDELFRIPLLGRWIRWLGAYPIDRSKGDVAGIRMVVSLLREGKVVLVFPEGTRSPDGRLQPLQEGTAWLAKRCRVPVVPVRIEGTHAAFPAGTRFPRRHPVCIQIFPAIEPEAWIDSEEPIHTLNQRLTEFLRKKEDENSSGKNEGEKTEALSSRTP